MNSAMIKDLSVMIAGKAGDGVLFTGNVLARLLKRHGWEVATYRDFPSNVRGEATCYTIRASRGMTYGLSDRVNILLAFDCDAIFQHIPQVAAGGVVFCDGEGVAAMDSARKKGKTFHRFLLRKMAKERFGHEIYKNMIVLGAMSWVLNLDTSRLQAILTEIFLEKKGEEVVRKNSQAACFGYDEAKKIISPKERHSLAKRPDKGRLILSGDEAIAFGALAAGCRFFAAYPICPASEIWQWLVHYIHDFNGVVVQTEDELAAINMALGASYAGARSMTSTSGPGASLMMEGFSLAGMAEIPVVIAHVQRVGPATGIPTKTQQGDITQWIFGSHGEFPKIVLSPGTMGECFDLTVKAFNLADKYQCPVIILTELDMGQNLRTTKNFNLEKMKIDRGKLLSQKDLLRIADFKRYALTPDGISPRAIPGMKNGLHMVESLEHDESGYRDEDPQLRVRMMEKRMSKLERARRDIPSPRLWGDRSSKTALIACGSVLGAILESMNILKKEGVRVKLLQLRTLWPFPAGEVEEFMRATRDVFVVENNYSGQLCTLLRSRVRGADKTRSILKYSSETFRPADIIKPIMKVVR